MSESIQIRQAPATSTGAGKNGYSGTEQLDWGALLSRSIHPTRLWIIEALRIIDRALSASELERVFDGKQSTSAISYHMNTLAKIGIIELADMQQVRGTWKRLYVFTTAVKPTLPRQPS
jgi:hypothetical protein